MRATSSLWPSLALTSKSVGRYVSRVPTHPAPLKPRRSSSLTRRNRALADECHLRPKGPTRPDQLPSRVRPPPVGRVEAVLQLQCARPQPRTRLLDVQVPLRCHNQPSLRPPSPSSCRPMPFHAFSRYRPPPGTAGTSCARRRRPRRLPHLNHPPGPSTCHPLRPSTGCCLRRSKRHL